MGGIVEGRAWVFGDSVDTDNMYPGFAMKLSPQEAAKHVFYDLRPGWTETVEEGDIVLGGRNFGIGSSRPVAQLFRELGIAALVAEEFNSLFFRNSINFGLAAVTIPDAAKTIVDGATVRLDIRRATIEPVGESTQLRGAPLPEFVLDILDRGGLLPKLAAEGYLPATSEP